MSCHVLPCLAQLDCFGLPSGLLAMLTTAKIAKVMYLVIHVIKHLHAVLLDGVSKPQRLSNPLCQSRANMCQPIGTKHLWNEGPSHLPLMHKQVDRRTRSASLEWWRKYAKITKTHVMKLEFSRNDLFRSPLSGGSDWIEKTQQPSLGYKMKSNGKCHSPCMLARFS